jgi:hypothetical protein
VTLIYKDTTKPYCLSLTGCLPCYRTSCRDHGVYVLLYLRAFQADAISSPSLLALGLKHAAYLSFGTRTSLSSGKRIVRWASTAGGVAGRSIGVSTGLGELVSAFLSRMTVPPIL